MNKFHDIKYKTLKKIFNVLLFKKITQLNRDEENLWLWKRNVLPCLDFSMREMLLQVESEKRR
jgi:hypothetical protein